MEPKQSKENALFEWYDSLVFALAVIVLFFVFAVRIITVSGVSMQPTPVSYTHLTLPTIA